MNEAENFEISPCDIILCKNSGIAFSIFRLITNSIFDHVLIALSKTILLEIRFPMTKFISINTFYQTYKNFLIIRVSLDESEKNSITKEIENSVGKKYDFIEGIKYGTSLTFRNFSFFRNKNNNTKTNTKTNSNQNQNQNHNQNHNQNQYLNFESLNFTKEMICTIRVFKIFYQNSFKFRKTVDNIWKFLDLSKIEYPSFDDFMKIACQNSEITLIKWENSGFWNVNKSNKTYEQIRESLCSSQIFDHKEWEIKKLFNFLIQSSLIGKSFSFLTSSKMKLQIFYKIFNHLYQKKTSALRILFMQLLRLNTNSEHIEPLIQTIFNYIFEKNERNSYSFN